MQMEHGSIRYIKGLEIHFIFFNRISSMERRTLYALYAVKKGNKVVKCLCIKQNKLLYDRKNIILPFFFESAGTQRIRLLRISCTSLYKIRSIPKSTRK